MTIPVITVLVMSLAWIAWRLSHRQPLNLPPVLAWGWGIVLGLAWVIQVTRWAAS